VGIDTSDDSSRSEGGQIMLPNETLAERNERLFACTAPVAFVSGSTAPRVGRRIAEYLLSQDFRVFLHAHRSSPQATDLIEQINASGKSAWGVVGNVQDEAQVASWVEETLKHFGRIDVVVNAAAIWEPKALEQTTAADYLHSFQVNTLGSTLCTQHFGLAMTRQEQGGAIINIGDWAVARPYRDFAAYFVSKAGIATLTQTMAVELGVRNPRVRVNAVLPGPILLADGVKPATRERIAQDCLLKREGTADDLAQAVMFLATSPFITGVCLPVDGGRSIWAGNSSDSVAHPNWSP
jgi:pteridine reductase